MIKYAQTRAKYATKALSMFLQNMIRDKTLDYDSLYNPIF